MVPASVLNSLWCIRPRAEQIKTQCIKYFTCTDTSQESHWVTGKTFLSTCGSHCVIRHDVPVCVKCKKVDFYIWYLIGVSIFAVVYHGWMQAHRHDTLFWRESFLLRGARVLQITKLIFQLQRHSTVLWVLLLGKSTDGGDCYRQSDLKNMSVQLVLDMKDCTRFSFSTLLCVYLFSQWNLWFLKTFLL